VLSNQTPVAGGSGFGLGLGIASPQAYPIRRVIRIGGIGRVAIPLDIPLSVALDHADIADLWGAVIAHACLYHPIGGTIGALTAEAMKWVLTVINPQTNAVLFGSSSVLRLITGMRPQIFLGEVAGREVWFRGLIGIEVRGVDWRDICPVKVSAGGAFGRGSIPDDFLDRCRGD
jgi:hypothetical protein